MAGARAIEETNRVLWDFLPLYNQRFTVPAAQPGLVFCQPEEVFIPDEVFCFKYYRTVGTDNVVRFGEYTSAEGQVLPTNGRSSYAHARVEVHEMMDGALAVYYQECCLAIRSAPPEAPVLRVRSIARVIPNMSNSDELAAPLVVTNRTLQQKFFLTAPNPGRIAHSVDRLKSISIRGQIH